MLSKIKGDIAVAHAILLLAQRGAEILLPIGDKRPYDLVAETDGDMQKIQVKYAGEGGDGKHIASLRITGGNKSFYSSKKYRDGDFDYLFVHSSDDRSFLIPWSVVASKSSICVDSPFYSQYLL